jgi:hypothetical protein
MHLVECRDLGAYLSTLLSYEVPTDDWKILEYQVYTTYKRLISDV